MASLAPSPRPGMFGHREGWAEAVRQEGEAHRMPAEVGEVGHMSMRSSSPFGAIDARHDIRVRAAPKAFAAWLGLQSTW